MEQLAILNNITSMTAEQQEAAAMHFEIVQAAKTAVNSLLDLGRKLKRMRDSGRYKDLGFSSFAEYTEAAVGIKQRQAYNYITVVESLPARLIEENAAAGVVNSRLGYPSVKHRPLNNVNVIVRSLKGGAENHIVSCK